MTTALQVKKLMGPLLERNPDLVLDGRWLHLKPVHHVLRTLLIDRTGLANNFTPRWAVIVLFRPTEQIDLKYGQMLAGRRGWSWDDPEMPSELCTAIENDALRQMRKIQTIEDFVEFASSPKRFPLRELSAFPHVKLLADIACGQLESARAACQQWRGRLPRWPEDPLEPIVDGLCPPLATNDVPALVRQLHTWEEYTVKQLKLEKIWERTPFPIELKGVATT
jgi:hypothetical protein